MLGGVVGVEVMGSLADLSTEVPFAPCVREGAEGTNDTQTRERSGAPRAAAARTVTRAGPGAFPPAVGGPARGAGLAPAQQGGT